MSESAQVKVVLQNDTQLDIQVEDQQEQNTTIESNTNESCCTEETSTNSQPDSKHKAAAAKNSELNNSTNSTKIVNETAELSSDVQSTEVIPSETAVQTDDTPGRDPAAEGGSFVTMEDDGSVFIRANSDYIESKETDRVPGFQDKATTGGGIQFSNKLMFSLD